MCHRRFISSLRHLGGFCHRQAPRAELVKEQKAISLFLSAMSMTRIWENEVGCQFFEVAVNEFTMI